MSLTQGKLYPFLERKEEHMNKEVLDSILPTMDTDDVVELVHNHLCGLRVIENKDHELNMVLTKILKIIQEKK